LSRGLLLLLPFEKNKAISRESSTHTVVSGFFMLLSWLLLETYTTEYPAIKTTTWLDIDLLSFVFSNYNSLGELKV